MIVAARCCKAVHRTESGLYSSPATSQFRFSLNPIYDEYIFHLLAADRKHLVESDFSLQNAIHDLGLSDIKTTPSLDQEDPVRTKMRLVAPDGTSVQEWHGFVGPVEIGLAVRRILGEPLYSGMESEVH